MKIINNNLVCDCGCEMRFLFTIWISKVAVMHCDNCAEESTHDVNRLVDNGIIPHYYAY
jgi:hypothetical protein